MVLQRVKLCKYIGFSLVRQLLLLSPVNWNVMIYSANLAGKREEGI